MKVLAFDIGATFGWAFGDSDQPTKVLRWGQEHVRGERPERLYRFSEAAFKLIDRRRPQLVVYERPFARGEAATRSLWGMAGVVDATAFRCKAAVFDAAPPVTLKKWFTGNHQASKEMMVLEAVKRLGAPLPASYNKDDPDERARLASLEIVLGEHAADAIATLLYTMAHLEPQETK